MQTTIKKLIHATIELSNKHGIAGAATAKIARKAKVANGTLFHHFPNKDKLIERAYLFIQEDYAWNTVGLFDYPEKMLVNRLQKVIRSSVDYWVKHRPSLVFTRQVYHSHYYNSSLQLQVEKFQKHFLQALQLGVKRQILVKMDVQVMNQMLFNGILHCAHLINQTTDDNKARQIRKKGTMMLWSALLGPKGS